MSQPRTPISHLPIIGLTLSVLIMTMGAFVESGAAQQLALLLVGLMVCLYFAMDTRGDRQPLLVGLIALALLVPVVAKDLGKHTNGEVRVWNVFHYYLGAKYFDELGYTDLYVAALAADRQGANYWTKHVDTVRDLNSYQLVTVDKALSSYEPERHFSKSRWIEFKEDVSALSQHRRARNWSGIFRDRGYNGTPVWTVIGGSLASLVDADSGLLILLCSLDLAFLLAMGWFVWRGFGVNASLFVLLLFVASPANIPRMVGGFMQFDWLLSIVASVCLLRINKPLLAGIAMAYAIMTRAFPVVLVAFLCLPAIRILLHERRIDQTVWRYGLGLCAGILFLLVASFFNSRGLSVWNEFIEAIALHSGDHVLGERRIGLEHIFSVDLMNLATEYSKIAREVFLQENQLAYAATAIFVVILALFTSWKRQPWEALLIGVIGLFAMFVLSRYYYAVLALLPLLSTVPRIRAGIVASQIAAYIAHAGAVYSGAEWLTQYVLLNIGLLIHVFIVLLLLNTRPAQSKILLAQTSLA